jgi:hypothetical protein
MTGDMDRRIEKLVLLLARSDGRFDDGNAQVFRVDDGVSLKRMRLSPDLYELAVGRGLVEVEADAIRLTPAGRASAAALSGHPQAYRLQHGAISAAAPDLPDVSAGVLMDDAESPLAWLHRRKGAGGVQMVDDAEFRAGERLRLDFTKGGMMPSVTSNWRDMASSGGGGRGGRADMTDAALAARDRVNAALRALDPELAGVAIDVCCFLKGLETVESDRQWPQRSAKVVLKMALRALARHYGIASEAVGDAGRGRLQHWGSADYRPDIGVKR